MLVHYINLEAYYMKNQLISEITRQMIPYLDNAQMEQLQNVLQHALWNVQITANEDGSQ